MCWSIDTPSVAPVTTTARELLPSTEADKPEAPAYGGTQDNTKAKHGKNALKIDLGTSYNPVNM
jgi:hypothetical protein